MNRWLHIARTTALTLILAGMLVSCGGDDDDDGGGGGGGGGNTVRLFFGMNGFGSCSEVVVNVDIGDAGAVLAREPDDSPDCSLAPTLIANGCDVSFSEIGGDDRLQVSIDGCTIPASANLFSCSFEDVDVSELGSEVRATCDCAVPGCDPTPPICVIGREDPAGCERCSNRIDDDGNGLVDCQDPNCEHSDSCDGTPITSTTNTTIPQEPLTIRFLLDQAEDEVGSLQLTINYASAPGQFDGTGAGVDCDSDIDGVLFAANDRDSVKRLNLGFISATGFDEGVELAACRFTAGTPVPVPANFTVVINEATDTDGHNIDVDVEVDVDR
jgi:hypothetical protein